MKVEAISAAPDAAMGTTPLMLVGEISHRVLNDYTHAITTLAIARAADPSPGPGRNIAESLAHALGRAIQRRFDPTGTSAILRIPTIG